jgi:hypothetical protein
MNGNLTCSNTLSNLGNVYFASNLVVNNNVGIGTSSPNFKLHVVDGQMGITNTNPGLTLTNTDMTNRANIVLLGRSNHAGLIVQSSADGTGIIQNWSSQNTGAGIMYVGSGSSNTNIVHSFYGFLNIMGVTGCNASSYGNNNYRPIGMSLLYGTANSNDISIQIGKNNNFYESFFFGHSYNATTPSNSYTYFANYGAGPSMVITGAGNVGIGTTNPSYRLDVNGTIRSSGSIRADSDGSYIGVGYVNPTLGFIKRSGEEQAIACCQPTNGYNAFIRFGQLQTSNFDSNFTGVAFNEWGRFNSNGYLGIGTSTPTCPLHVVGQNASFNSAGAGYLFNYTLSSLLYSGTNNGINWSIRAENHVGAAGFVAASDMRIKTNVESIQTDFEKFQNIRAVEYTYIDPLKRGGKQLGFIAQEVSEILPDVVDKTNDVVPNIFKKSILQSNQLTIPEDVDLATGDKIRIVVKDVGIKDTIILSITDNIATCDYTNEKDDEIFIYGKHVDDFLNINHDHLLAYTVAHTQELYNHTQELYKKLSNSLDRISYLEQAVSKMS